MTLGRGSGARSLKEVVESLTVDDPRLPTAQGYNPLHIAAIRGRIDVCCYLVEELGVDVNCADKEGSSISLNSNSCHLFTPNMIRACMFAKTICSW